MTSTNSHIDLTYLKEVSGGEFTFIKEILTMFIIHTVPDFAYLKSCCAEKDYNRIASAAHKIKSSITMIGNTKATESIVFIEHSAKANTDIALINEEVIALGKEIDLIVQDINSVLKQN